jgi:gas vesicle protein
MRGRQRREVVYVERGGDSSAKWLFWGALLGAGLALLYAPSSGEETRRNLQRKLWKLRAMTEEKLDEITQQFGGAKDSLESLMEDGRPLYRQSPGATPREELERRLADARARRRSPDLEEPLA